MKVPYEEDLASHFGLCRRCEEGNDFVLSVRVRGSVGQLSSSEILPSVCRPCPVNGKATPHRLCHGKIEADTAESLNLCVRRNPKRENRELPSVCRRHLALAADGSGQRTSPRARLA